MSILDDRCQHRLAPCTMGQQLAALNAQLVRDAQRFTAQVPSQTGSDDQADITAAFEADAITTPTEQK